MTYRCNACIISFVFAWNTIYNMREWLSGGAPPCQGGGRGFDPRLALSKITKRTSEWEVLFCYSRSAGHFSKPNCLAVWVRFLGTLKRPSVVPEPRSTGPCGTRLALSKITKGTYFTSPCRNSRVFCELCSQKTPRGMLPVNQWYLDNANNT